MLESARKAPRSPTARVSARRPTPGLRALNASGDGFWEWDLLSGTAWYSDWFAPRLGWEAQVKREPLRAWQNHILDDDWPQLLREMRAHLEQRRPLDVDVRVRSIDGALVWWRITGSAVRDTVGRPTLLCGSVRDVTARRRSLDHAESNQRLLHSAFDSLPIATAILGGDGEILDVNRNWREHTAIGAPFGLRFGFGENYLNLCAAAAVRHAYCADLHNGIAELVDGKVDEFSLDYECESPEGTRQFRCIARSCQQDLSHWTIVAHFDLTGLGTPLTPRFDFKRFYEMILDAIPIHVAYIGRNHRLQYLNRSYEEWLQLPFAAVKDHQIEELADENHRAEFVARIERVLQGSSVSFEVERNDGEGHSHALEVAYLPHWDRGESVQGFFTVARDVTAEKRLEAELRQAQKLEAIGQLSGGLAHDLNNLLGVIVGNLQLLRRKLDPGSNEAKAADTALRAATSGADLAKNLLAFARQQPLIATSVDINAVIAGVEDLLARAAGEQICIELRLGKDMGHARLDHAQFENALLNLVLNARDAMAGQGKIWISTRAAAAGETGYPPEAPARALLIEVADNGPGMIAEVAGRAFEPFFTTKPPGQGTGLGLATVYGFARQSGGTATIDTQAGNGTRIRLWFPREEECSNAS